MDTKRNRRRIDAPRCPGATPKTLIAAALIALAFAAAGGAGEDRCPHLPADSGLVWVYRAGPDFDLCYAQRGGTKEQVFGLYFGTAPSFSAIGRTGAESGMVGGHAVTWFATKSDTPALAYGREALLELASTSGSPPLKVHVWASAATPQELAKALAVLRDIEFR